MTEFISNGLRACVSPPFFFWLLGFRNILFLGLVEGPGSYRRPRLDDSVKVRPAIGSGSHKKLGPEKYKKKVPRKCTSMFIYIYQNRTEKNKNKTQLLLSCVSGAYSLPAFFL